VGAWLPIHEPLGNMVVDVGGGTSEVAVISLGGVVALEAVRVGGFDMGAAIQAYVRNKYGMAIGERTGEEGKFAIGSAFAAGDRDPAEGPGPGPTTRTAKGIGLDPEDLREALDEPVRAILEMIVRALGQTPPELAQDLILRGIHLVGGGGLLRGMDERISKETALPVRLVDAPLECVVHGAGLCM